MSDSIYEGAIREKIARDSTDSKPLLKEFSSALFETLREGLLLDGHVRIHQFGSFKLKWSNERKGKHPRTGESLIIPAQPRITFTAAKALKDKVNSEQTDLPEQTVELHEVAIPEPETSVSITAEPVVRSEMSDITVIESPGQTKQPATVTQTQNTRMTAIAATVLFAAVIGYFIISPSQQATVQTTDMPSEPASHVLTTSTSNPSAINSQITTTETESDTAPEIAITTDSSSSPVTVINDAVAAVSTDPTTPFFSKRRHRLVNGDSLWRLSRKSYTNPFYWPHIYQANRNIRNPNKLRMGSTITLPSLYGSPDELTAEDKRNIAEGYFQVYRYYKKTDKPFPYYALLGASKFDPAVIQDHIYEIDEQDWQSLQLASN